MRGATRVRLHGVRCCGLRHKAHKLRRARSAATPRLTHAWHTKCTGARFLEREPAVLGPCAPWLERWTKEARSESRLQSEYRKPSAEASHRQPTAGLSPSHLFGSSPSTTVPGPRRRGSRCSSPEARPPAPASAACPRRTARRPRHASAHGRNARTLQRTHRLVFGVILRVASLVRLRRPARQPPHASCSMACSRRRTSSGVRRASVPPTKVSITPLV